MSFIQIVDYETERADRHMTIQRRGVGAPRDGAGLGVGQIGEVLAGGAGNAFLAAPEAYDPRPARVERISSSG